MTGKCEWRQKLKRKKIPRAWSETPKNPMLNWIEPKVTHLMLYYKTVWVNYISIGTKYGNNFFTVNLLSPQKSLLKSHYPKKYLPKFSYPKTPQNCEFQTQKNPSHLHVTLNPEYPPELTVQRSPIALLLLSPTCNFIKQWIFPIAQIYLFF